MKTFFLGTHEPSWLRRVDVPLFISHRRLKRLRKRLPRAHCAWALDSGGFTELASPPHRWVTTVPEYLEAVARYEWEIGNLLWAAPMDWMCEPWIIQETGLSVREHQERTVANYLELRGRGPFIPVLQGWTLEDYESCIGLYLEAGIELPSEPLVGVGSVCRRQSTVEIGRIMHLLKEVGISAHGFGVKKEGLLLYHRALTSADSMSWSYRARRAGPQEGCTHKSCANCLRFALRWRQEALAPLAILDRQLTLL